MTKPGKASCRVLAFRDGTDLRVRFTPFAGVERHSFRGGDSHVTEPLIVA